MLCLIYRIIFHACRIVLLLPTDPTELRPLLRISRVPALTVLGTTQEVGQVLQGQPTQFEMLPNLSPFPSSG